MASGFLIYPAQENGDKERAWDQQLIDWCTGLHPPAGPTSPHDGQNGPFQADVSVRMEDTQCISICVAHYRMRPVTRLGTVRFHHTDSGPSLPCHKRPGLFALKDTGESIEFAMERKFDLSNTPTKIFKK